MFDVDVRAIADSVGGRAIVAPLKKVGRAAAKVASDYQGDATQLKDLVRGTIELQSPADADTVIAQLRAKYGEPIKLKSSMDPSLPPPFANGYRDMNSVWSINGEPVEIQVNVPEMLEAKKKAHPFYVERETLWREIAGQGRGPTPDEESRLAELDARQAAIYQPAWEAAIRRMNSSRDISTASSSNEPPVMNRPSGQTRAEYRSSDASLPFQTPNTALAENSGSGAARPDNVVASSIADSVAPAPEPEVVNSPAAPAAAALTLQNRDRSRVASVAQMQGIAANPDPSRLSFSRDPNTGAPMASARNVEQVVPQGDLGRADSVVMPTGRRIPVRYAVVEADAVAASHRADGSTNPDYEGAPIRALNNGRVAGLQAAWQRGNAEGYRQGLIDDAGMLGIDPEAIRAKRNPVLVRLYGDEHNQGDMGAESNASSNLGLSPVEQASTDARALPDLSELPVTDAGDLSQNPAAPFYRRFLQALGGNEAAKLVDGEGRLNKVFFDRLKAAVFARAYGNDRMIAAMAEDADPDARNVLNALVKAAPEWAKVERDGPLGDYAKRLTAGFETLRAAREAGQSVESFLSQGDMFGRDASGDVWAHIFASYARSASKIAEALRDAARIVADAQSAARSGDMFGAEPPSASDVDARVRSNLEQRNERLAAQGSGTQISLFGAGGGIANRSRFARGQDEGNRSGAGGADGGVAGRDAGRLGDNGLVEPHRYSRAPSSTDRSRSVHSLRDALEQVKEIAVRVLAVKADQGVVAVIGDADVAKARVIIARTATEWPQEVLDAIKKDGESPGSFPAVHFRGKSYIAADKMRSASDVQEALYHEHYTHGGLRAKYDAELDPLLTRLFNGIGGIVGVRRIAREQGIDIKLYEDASGTTGQSDAQLDDAARTARDKRNLETQRRILIEELMANASKTTGTLRRLVEEYVGALRDFLRRHGLAKLADYGMTDLAHVMKQARLAAQQKDGTGARWNKVFYQRVFHGTPHRGIEKEGFKLTKIGSGEGAQAFGWGIYFASQREVADGYRNALSVADVDLYLQDKDGRRVTPDEVTADERVLEVLNDVQESFDNDATIDPDLDRILDDLHLSIKWGDLGIRSRGKLTQNERATVDPDDAELLDTLDEIERVRENFSYQRDEDAGQLYSANIPKDSDLLDWDKPLSEQSAKVRKALVS